MESIDLVIIGSGPAGISTALHLLQIDPGWSQRMLVLEKAAHPRHKLCGGGVTESGFRYLQRLGFQLPLPIPHARVDDVRLVYCKRTVHVHGSPKFAVFHRAEFDAYLAKEAQERGVVIHENEPVSSISVEKEAVLLTTPHATYRTRAVVGADGSKGVARRAVNPFERKSHVARLLEVIEPASEQAPHFSERFAVFDFTPLTTGLQGYFWDFPSCIEGKPAFNRGLYDARLAQSRPKARLVPLLQDNRLALGSGTELPPLASHPIHTFSPRNRFSAPRLVLVGDAAGAEPLFGEGIAPALGYGKVAARSIDRAFQSGDFSFRDYRRWLLVSPVGRYLLLRWYIAWWSYRLSGRDWYVHALWTIGKWLAALYAAPSSNHR